MDDLVNRLRDDAGCSQGTCLSCTKGFENHEYGCTEGEYCLDSVAVLKKTRKRLRKVSLEAAARITELESALKEAREVEEAFLQLHGWITNWETSFDEDTDWIEHVRPEIERLANKLLSAKLLNHRNA